ncbi:MAG: hypothetical protein ACRDZQ_08025 [Acidimicrobiales bacterium]
MPTFEATERFWREYHRLSPERRGAFRRTVERFVADLQQGSFRAGLRVKGIAGMPGCFEMTWEADGRAIFTYGPEVRPGETHVVWLAVGSHAVLP